MLSIIFGVTLMGLANYTSAFAQDTAASPPADSAGLTIYLGQYCGVCHVLEAASSRGVFGPTHNGIGTIAASRIEDRQYDGTAETAEAYIRESILKPQIYLVPGYGGGRYAMPAYTNLDEEEIDALVSFLMNQLEIDETETE
jgi:nitric oxide reductase subunit C